MQEYKYVIIGGGLAGGHAAISIRENDPEGSILLVAGEGHLPYDRVPLSKNYLYGKMPADALYFKKKDYYDSNRIGLEIGKRVLALDPGQKIIVLEGGSQIRFGKLLLATGGRTRRLDLPGSNLKNVFYMHTIEDSDKVRAAMEIAKNVVVIGGGFIGCELASSLEKRGIRSTIVEVGGKILGRVFDDDTATWVQKYFERKGVRVLTRTVPERILERDGRAVGVQTTTGEKLEADFVVVGIGVAPDAELAEKAGLRTENGIWCDEYLKTSSQDIYAAGDVANFYSGVFGRQMRLEHYDLAVRQGMTAGANMAGKAVKFDEIPYFFSFMFDIRMEVYGDLGKYDKVVLRGNPDEGRFIKFYMLDGAVNAIMLVNTREDLDSIKNLIRSRQRFSDLSVLRDGTAKLADVVAAKVVP